jgi:hypothetical protein
MRRHRPFPGITSLAASAVAAFVLLTPAAVLPAQAQAARAATGFDSAKPDSYRPAASQTTGVGNVAAVEQASVSQPKSVATKAIDKL